MLRTCAPPCPPTPTKPTRTSGIGGAAKPADSVPAACGTTAGEASVLAPDTEAPTMAPAICRNVRRSGWVLFGSDMGWLLSSSFVWGRRRERRQRVQHEGPKRTATHGGCHVAQWRLTRRPKAGVGSGGRGPDSQARRTPRACEPGPLPPDPPRFARCKPDAGSREMSSSLVRLRSLRFFVLNPLPPYSPSTLTHTHTARPPARAS